MRKRASILFFICVIFMSTSYAQLSISSSDTPFLIDFESTVSGVIAGTFDGSGFAPSPTVGQLDSDAWKVEGWSDGDLAFGGSNTSGDYARGQSTGSESTGGIYAFDIGSGDIILGVQPGGTDFTPGSFTLRVANSTGGDLKTFEIAYHINVFNNGGYSSNLNLLYSNDNITYYNVSELEYVTTEVADGVPSWTEIIRTAIISVHLADSESLYLQWLSDDVSGGGSRDEFGLDDINITARDADEGILITEVVDHGDDFNESYVEVFNSGTLDVNIENWKLIERYDADNVSERESVVNSSTQVNAGGSGYLTLTSNEYAVFVRGDAAGLKTRHAIADAVALFEDSVPQLTGDERYQLVNAVGDVIDNFGLWNYVDAGSFRFENANAYERTGGESSNGELEVSWTKSSIGSYSYTPGTGNINNLPVELVDFTSSVNNNAIELNWQTATEVNNYGFNVERAILNSQFSILNWTKLGFVPGNGTTNSPKSYLFVDKDLPNVDKVSYRLKQIDNDGTSTYSKVVEVDLSTITGVNDGKVNYKFALDQNYPNPFNPSTTIKFTLPGMGLQNHVKLTVYNLLGQKVRTLVNEVKPAGQFEVKFDASQLPSGIYFYTLSYGSYIQTRKLVLMK